MRRFPLPLVAATAAVGAMAIAVPALASSGSSPAAHSARARHCSAVIVISHHHRVRACLIHGPRGYTGFNGATGKTGTEQEPRVRDGPQGEPGAPGIQGPEPARPGPTRSYNPPQRPRSTSSRFNITAVTSRSDRCLLHHPRSRLNRVEISRRLA